MVRNNLLYMIALSLLFNWDQRYSKISGLQSVVYDLAIEALTFQRKRASLDFSFCNSSGGGDRIRTPPFN